MKRHVNHAVCLLIAILALASCSNKSIEYIGSTEATESQKKIITQTLSVLFASHSKCLSIFKIEILEHSELLSNDKIGREIWEASGCDKTQRFSVEIHRDSNILKIDPISWLLPNNSFKPNLLRKSA